MTNNLRERLAKITTFIFDYDGVLTNGQVILTNDGEALRSANVKDGYAMQYAIKKGYRIAIISGGRSAAIQSRFEALSVKDVFMGAVDKEKVFNDYIRKYKLNKSQVLYMGDDIPDYTLMKVCGVSACPADAAPEIKKCADFVSSINGGNGCVREIIETTLNIHKQWFDKKIAFHW